jgi:hypothetical protein
MGVFLTFLNHNRRAGDVLVLGIDRSAPHIDGQIGKTSCQSSSARLLGCLGKKDASGTFLPNVDNHIFGSSINGNVLFLRSLSMNFIAHQGLPLTIFPSFSDYIYHF